MMIQQGTSRLRPAIKCLLIFIWVFNSCSERPKKAPVQQVPESLCDKALMPEVINRPAVMHLLKQFPELGDCKIPADFNEFAICGDFYGDGADDIAVLLTQNDTIKVCVIDMGKNCGFHFLGTGNDALTVGVDYSWAGVFKAVEPGMVLWSNYEEDFRSFEEVPENEKVKLTHHSIYVHQAESCGGGYIFWKDGKFNWLQQE